MRSFVLGLVVVGALLGGERAAHAISACGGETGWALPAKSVVPVHPRVVLYMPDFEAKRLPQPITKINGKVVPATLTTVDGPQVMAIIEVDSDKTGTLKITWSESNYPPPPTVTYTIKKAKPVTAVTGTFSRFHQAYRHSTVHELEDGLEVAVTAKAVRFTVKWRRDANTAWQTLEVPAMTRKSKQVLHLGEIGCNRNFAVSMLSAGIDLELTAILADGSAIAVTGLPAHIVLPALPKDAAQSSP